MLEKYTSNWQVQFAAGVKTIAVIAVSQGVLQLGSTQTVIENIGWVDKIRTVFGAPQNSSEIAAQLEVIGGDLVTNPQGTASESLCARPFRASISQLVTQERVDHLRSAFGASQNSSRTVALSDEHGGNPMVCPGTLPENLSSRLCKANISQPVTQRMVDVPNTGLQSRVYGFSGGASLSIHSNSVHPLILESLQMSTQNPEALKILNMKATSVDLKAAFDERSRKFEILPTVPDLELLSKQEAPLSCPGDLWSIQSENGHVQFPLTDAFSSVGGHSADILGKSVYEQSNESDILLQDGLSDPKSSFPLLRASELQAEGSSLFGLCPDNNILSSSDLSGLVGNIGWTVAPGSQDPLLGAFVQKSGGGQELHGNSAIGNSLQENFQNEETCNPRDRKKAVPFTGGRGNKNLISGGFDGFEAYLAVAQAQSSKWDRSFGIGDELSQALGPSFQNNHIKGENKHLEDDQNIVAIDKQSRGQACALSGVGAAELVPSWESNFVKMEPLYQDSKSESLLDAVIASASNSHLSISTAADDSISCRTLSSKDSEFSAPKVTYPSPFKGIVSHTPQDCMSQSFVHASSLGCDVSGGHQAMSKTISDPLGFNMSNTISPLKTILNSWTDDMQSTRSDSTQTSQVKKPEDLAKVTRKRARPGESTRPRPKDRQQIQDRVRELREIVPNGSKCSIDALLEKTIKHMLFLQNVTLHADNLKKNGELKDDIENGASWALELGGEETGRPPILVKNLSQPRQLLVEMFCEEKGHFLEIADIIRGLGLTILKGVMEARHDKVWARFIVEAYRDVRRVDIMMSLMHLLHVNNNSSSSMSVTSGTAPLRSQPGPECSSSSQTHILNGFPQPSLHA
ncbi:hypothetical protein KP509_19G054500 [Ceratopteris richardii]|nr:hypothetical protein KP509_19G054500 [Ceratopteris richardii]